MAKYEKTLEGNFSELLDWLHNDITKDSISAGFRGWKQYHHGGKLCILNM